MTYRRYGIRLRPWTMTVVGSCGFMAGLACALAGEWFPAIFFLVFGLIYLSSALVEKKRNRGH